jgi:hypothetical protein
MACVGVVYAAQAGACRLGRLRTDSDDGPRGAGRPTVDATTHLHATATAGRGSVGGLNGARVAPARAGLQAGARERDGEGARNERATRDAPLPAE